MSRAKRVYALIPSLFLAAAAAVVFVFVFGVGVSVDMTETTLEVDKTAERHALSDLASDAFYSK